jgi:hypothetical protein
MSRKRNTRYQIPLYDPRDNRSGNPGFSLDHRRDSRGGGTTFGVRTTCSSIDRRIEFAQSDGAGDASLENGSRGEEETTGSVEGTEDMMKGRTNERVGTGAAIMGISRAAKTELSADLGTASTFGKRRLSGPGGKMLSSDSVGDFSEDRIDRERGGVIGAINVEPEPVDESEPLGVMPISSRS